VREGHHITIVGTSLMVQEALHAADEPARHGVEAEIIDLRSVRPLDEETILQSIKKTGHLVVAARAGSCAALRARLRHSLPRRHFLI
jgi:pyruvate/2-oxoglutarate/acetoin dehydrogenase E1 component